MKHLIGGLHAVFLLLLLVNCRTEGDEAINTRGPSATETTIPEIGVTFSTIVPPKTEEIQIAVTPSQEPFPTPMATPVLYSVKAGDTLFDIAAIHGTNIEQILELNLELQPEILQVGQLIILPPAPTIEPSLVPIPDEPFSDEIAEIAGLRVYPSATGGLWILGEIQNSSAHALENVKVELVLKESSNGPQFVENVWVTPALIAAGTSAPFGLFVHQDLADILPQASVIMGNMVNDLGDRYLDLAVIDTNVTIDGFPKKLSGRVENIGDETVARVLLVSTYYDDQQFVTGYSELWLEGSLSPGTSLPFEIDLLPPGNQVDEYTISAMGLRS